MARRKIAFVQGGFYHLYNRGVNREPIFRSADNYHFLLKRIKHYALEWHVAIIAYCLMPNHYHFVVRQESAQPLSEFIQALFNSYTKAFNKMHNRSGTLFEGPSQALVVDREEYLLHLCRYVHRNPLDAKLVNDLSEWPYSNYLEWTAQREGKLVDSAFVRSRFATPQAYTGFVLDYVPPKLVENVVRRLACD